MIKTYNLCIIAHPAILTKLVLQSNYRMTVISMKIMKTLSYDQNCELHKMSEIEKQAVGFPVVCDLVAKNLHKVTAPNF